MSHSVVKEMPTHRDNTYVIVVGQDGRISVDKETLDDLISCPDNENRQVSVLRVDNDDGSTVEMRLDTYDTDGMDELTVNIDEVTRNYNSFRMDHCYTPLTSPSQQRPLVTDQTVDLELDDLAHTLSILEGTDKPDDHDIKPVKKPIQKEPKKVSVLNKVNKLGVQKVYKGMKTVLAKSPKLVKKQVPEEPDDIESELQSLESDEISPKAKSFKRTYKRRPKFDPNEVSSELKQKIVKIRKGVKNILYKPITEKPAEKVIEKVVTPEPKVELPPPAEVVKSPDKKGVKKDKKPLKTIDDGIALFSTPDIIRRVGDKPDKGLPISPETPVKAGKIEDKQKHKLHARNSLDSKLPSPDKIKKDRMSLEGKGDRRPSNDRLQSALEQANMAMQSNLNTPDTVYEDMSGMQTEPSADVIRSIIHTEDTKTFSQSIDLPTMEPTAVEPIGLEAPSLDIEQGLLDNINADELIPEEILYQVAKLVENPDLQHAIDRTLVDGSLNLENSIPANLSQPGDVTSLLAGQGVPVANDGHLGKSQTPKQIVRSDGRVVTLPPIEKPATRSSKKKQDGPSNHYASEQVPQTPKGKAEPAEEAAAQASDFDSDSDASWNSEDDPDRLWCICKQPHNNRFMICCDTCEDWFHGKCVNVTKAMGQQMEQQGKEWMCPYCVKKLGGEAIPKNVVITKPAKIMSDVVSPRKSVESASPACIVCGAPSRSSSVYCSDQCILKHAQGVERETKQTQKPPPKIILFERATGKLITGSNAPSTANLKQWLRENPGFEVVKPVTKQAQTLTQSKPQTLTQSKLQLVKTPGKSVALAVNRKGVQVGILPHTSKQPQPAQNAVKIIPPAKMNVPGAKPQQKPQIQTKLQLQAPKPKVQTTLKTPPPAAVAKPKPPTPTVKVEKPVTPKVIKPKPAPDTPTTPTAQNKGQDNIRDNVKKTLFEHLNLRLKEVEDLKLTEDEVNKLAAEIELQLYKLFGDAGPKYRTKYRSLIFNIKDTKNQTLWRRICEKAIAPTQLVRLSPDELASQELARWRERENKHQIEMIKKSELEMLSINRTYVLKTHKGEQVLEDRSAVKVDSADIISGLGADSTSEDMSVSTDKPDSDQSSDRKSSKHSRRDRDRDKQSSKDRSSSKDRRNSKDHGSNRDRRKRSRSRDKDRSSHRSDRKRSRSRDRHHRSSHKSSRHKRDKHMSTDHLDKKSREILDNLENNKIVPPPEDRLWKHVPQQDIQVATPVDSDSDHEPSSTVTIPTPPRSIEQEEQPPQSAPSVSAEAPSVVSKPEQKDAKVSVADPRMNRTVSTESAKSEAPQPPTPVSESPVASPKAKITSESKETIIWEGNVNMVEVAKFFITLHEVSGDCGGLGTELPSTLEIVGRISPETVWDYIGKMRRSNSKLISILRLTAANMEEMGPYLALYSYLSSRNRLGVIKSTNTAVKDFYILPLASNASVPSTLLPLTGPGFEESRPHLLLGIIVRAKRKRLSTMDIISGTIKRSRVENSPPPVVAVPVVPPRSYTPPPSRDPRIKLPAVPVAAPLPPDDEDEPYSPEDSDPEAPAPAITMPVRKPTIPKPATDITSFLTTTAPTAPSLSTTEISTILTSTLKTSTFLDTPIATTFVEPFSNKFDGIPGLDVDTGVDSLQRKMEELDKCIEKQKEEIRSISQDIASSGAANMATNLSNISLPSNLQQILDSIKNIPSTSATDQGSGVDEYYPMPGYKSTASNAKEELTIPLLLPKINSRQTTKTIIPETTATIPLKLPVTPREISTDNLTLPNLSIPPPRTSSLLPATNILPPVVLPNLSIPPPASIMPPQVTIPLNLPKPKPKVPPVAALSPPGTSPVVIPPTESKTAEPKPVSVLSSLSEEELIRKAAEMLGESDTTRDVPSPVREVTSPKKSPSDKGFAAQAAFKSAPVMYSAPPPPIIPAMSSKRLKLDYSQPPVPGMEEEDGY